MTILHDNNPRLLLYSNKEVVLAAEKIAEYFVEFCVRRKPIPEFQKDSLRESQFAAVNFLEEFFTQEKDLVLRVTNNELTGFCLFDPQAYTLQGVNGPHVELVIAGTLHFSPQKNISDAKKIITAYENYKGRPIAANIRREWKRKAFLKVCEKIGFKEIGENAYEFQK